MTLCANRVISHLRKAAGLFVRNGVKSATGLDFEA